ncbi:MAG: epoxyqueuosine reductase [Firmicutes bacterium]|jgi:epoxyqueuosine reductase|nr:epoxyqueuosine reductase [Bacillota bacterium]
MNYQDLCALINEFVEGSTLNKVEEAGIKKIYSLTLVGVAAADDPLFLALKSPSVIGEHHLLPREWLPGAKAVISYYLPFSAEVREANRELGLPAREWLYGRIEGEEFNNALRRHLVEEFVQKGARAVSPILESRFSVVERRSNWSERHVAYIAGLGTFSLSKALITKKGCAGRFGSVIVALPLEPIPREYTELYQYCNMCGGCIERCPSGAIKREGKIIATCASYLETKIKPRFYPRYGCGKCQTNVPCEHKLPNLLL